MKIWNKSNVIKESHPIDNSFEEVKKCLPTVTTQGTIVLESNNTSFAVIWRGDDNDDEVFMVFY